LEGLREALMQREAAGEAEGERLALAQPELLPLRLAHALLLGVRAEVALTLALPEWQPEVLLLLLGGLALLRRCARGLCRGRLFSASGALIATTMQEGLIRPKAS
jgi:hypothetical protein